MKNISNILNSHKNTDSPIEEILFNEFKIYALSPIPQHPIGPFFLDLAFPDIKLAIEADGFEFHSTEEHLKNDKSREEKLKSWGWKVERFTGKFIHSDYDVAVAKIALKYFYDYLDESLQKRAIGRIVHHFTAIDPDFAQELTETALKGWIHKKIY